MGIFVGTTEPKIYVGEGGGDDYSAMRGPCPEGYHVPTRDEMQSLIDTGVSLSAWTTGDTNMSIYLKLPPTGYRSGGSSSGTVSSTGSGYYQTCEKSSSSNNYYLTFYSTTSIKQAGKTSAYAIRPFKDSPVVPDNNWTTIYSGTGNAGIFHNNTLGLISISSDGTNRITIADKNLGATVVWNSGDTTNQSNKGGFYQRGNNYMFPATGSITTSSTQVDASDYGPGNYYNSSTFIYGGGDWSSVTNNNLRGGVTGVTKGPNVREVYKGTTKIRPVSPTPTAEYTDWDSDVVDYVSQAFSDAGYVTGTAIANLFGGDFAQSIETATGTDLSDWEFSPIMPFYPITTSWYGLQISNGGDMIDKHLVPEVPYYTQSICIIRDNDNLDDVEYIVGTYDSSDDGFDYQLSSLASNFSGKDTVLLFIFK